MADDSSAARTGRRWSAIEPLRERSFRTIWSASLLSNFGQLILGVGAAWEMTRLTSSPGMVALVQSALMLPLMLVSVPAGAIADMFDRRKVALAGLSFACASAVTLTTLAFAGLTSPWLLLCFCALIGGGVAFYGPAWQASIVEQVESAHAPAAVALGAVSYNIARSFGPAVGGLIVVAAGATAAFAVNAIFYLPLLIAFYYWRRQQVKPRLPPERLGRAIISGARYVMHSPPIRIVLLRALAFGLAGAALAALTPLVARDLLGGDARTYGVLLGANGAGAVMGALLVSAAREHLKAEHTVTLCSLVGGAMLALIGLSHQLWLTGLAMVVIGAAYMLLISLLNVGVQLSVPRWVTARALSWFQSALTLGIGLGAWWWGHAAADWGVSGSLVISGLALALTPLLAFVLPIPSVSLDEVEMVDLGSEPQVALPLTPRSGPIVLEVDYVVAPEQARDFYKAMLQLQRARMRNGAFDWSLARDISDPMLWTERCHCPTWADYLHLRGRFTHLDDELQRAADAFHLGRADSRVRRRLERPFGSVRWDDDSRDRGGNTITAYPH